MILTIFLVLLLLLFKPFFHSNYNNIVKKFVEIDIHKITDKIINEDEFILLIGKESCPSCVKFVSMLDQSKFIEENEIHYLDLEKNASNKEYLAFQKKYKIHYVPQIIVFHDGNYFLPKTPANKHEVKELFDYLNYLKGRNDGQ